MIALQNLLVLLLLALLWGPSFFFIKIAVSEISPLTLVLGRVGIAAGLLYLLLRLRGQRLPKFGPIWKHFAVIGFFSNALPFTLFNWSELYISSALASILNGTTPLFTLVLAHFFVADDRVTPLKAVGALMGFGGLVVLIAPSLFGGVHATTLGLIAATSAAASYGIALVYTRKYLRGLPPLVGPTAQLLVATVYIAPLAFIIDQPWTGPIPSWQAVGSLLFLAVLGTGVAFVFYYRLIERASATFVSMVTYLVPVVGLALGVFILNEQPGWNAYAGGALILLGVMIVNGAFRFAHRRIAAGLGVKP